MTKILNSQDPVTNGFNDFLLHYGVFLAIGVAAIIAIIIVAVFLLRSKKSKEVKPVKEYSSSEILDSLGGKDNIVEHKKAGSRISLVLKDYSKVNEIRLNALGVDSIIKMSNKITLVVKDDVDSFYKLFN